MDLGVSVVTENGETPVNGGPYYLLSVTYNGRLEKAELRLYDPRHRRIVKLYDGSGHKPYFYVNLPPEDVTNIARKHKGFLKAVKKVLYDSLRDEKIVMTKVIAKDPLSVGGGKNSLRERFSTHWESKIKYHLCYIYDTRLIPGMAYRVVNGKLRLDTTKLSPELEAELLEKVLSRVDPSMTEYLTALDEWARTLAYPIINIRRVAVDIEVATKSIGSLPDVEKASQPVIAIAFAANDGLRTVLVLRRPGINKELKGLPKGVRVRLFDKEVDLLREAFEVIRSYPVVVTFNGDSFDLPYLRHRAENLGIKRDEIPISLGRDHASVDPGVHIDLYKFFSNRAIKVYAFGNRYEGESLDLIAKAILGKGKIKVEDISRLSYGELARYCYNDAEITLELTTYNNDLVMRLILLLMRISKLPMEDLTRAGVSKWVQNMLYFEHRRRGFLIPNQEDIIEIKGEATTKALIKGKKYMGAKVLKPVPGLHFNVVVMDFASLYPSIIKTWNLSYETVNCPHRECMRNKVPNTPHWVCTKRRGMTSVLIGALRDLRVDWFKPKSKDKRLPKEVRETYKVVQSAMKVVLNAAYGVFGSSIFALYCPPMAESTTAIGRHYIDLTIKKAQEMNLQILYGDTDSIFIKNPSEEQISELIDWAERELKIDLEIDKEYKYVSFSHRKKNYVGLLKDGTFDIKGVKGKKRDTPGFLKEAFNEALDVLRNIKGEEDVEYVKRRLSDIVKNNYKMLKARRIPLEKLAMKAQLGKDIGEYKSIGPHVKAAMMLQKRGIPIGKGDTIAYVKVNTKEEYKPVRLARGDEIDVEKYVEHMRTIFEQLLDAFGVSFDELLGGARDLSIWFSTRRG